MNILRVVTLSLAVLAIAVFGLFVSAPEAEAAKPDRCSPWPECRDEEPPPPEPIDGTACVDSTGDFPALAYYDVVKVGKRRKQKDIATVYIANSNGECSIPIWTGEDNGPGYGFTFQLIGSSGHILWTHGSGEIVRLQFDIENRAIMTPLPLGLPELVYVTSETPVGVLEAILSADGTELYFGKEVGDPVGWIDTINVIDLENCANLPCPANPVLTLENRFPIGLATSPDGSRIYFATNGVGGVPGVQSLSFIEKLPDDTWSGIKDVVTSNDSGYTQSTFGANGWTIWPVTSAALVDYGAGPVEVLAFNRGDPPELPTHIDLMSVADCDITLPGTCLANGNATLVGPMLPGELAEFTSLSSDSGIPASSILVRSDTGVFEEWDPRTVTKIRDILVGKNITRLPQSGN